MPAKPVFTPAQQIVIKAAAQRVWKKKFKWMKKTEHHPAGQEAMALALGISQQSVSELLKEHGKYNPGVKVAACIAQLDGQTLHQLVGDYEQADAASPAKAPLRLVPREEPAPDSAFPNLDVCVRFHDGHKSWSEWTIAAAKAGYYGKSDFPASAWTEKLDALEAALKKARTS